MRWFGNFYIFSHSFEHVIPSGISARRMQKAGFPRLQDRGKLALIHNQKISALLDPINDIPIIDEAAQEKAVREANESDLGVVLAIPYSILAAEAVF